MRNNLARVIIKSERFLRIMTPSINLDTLDDTLPLDQDATFPPADEHKSGQMIDNRNFGLQ